MFDRCLLVTAVAWALLVPAASSSAAAEAARIDLRLEGSTKSPSGPAATTRVADETRVLAAATGRIRLALRPVQVATGGRVFVHSDIPADLAATDLRIDVFLRENGAWVARRSFVREAGRVGRVSLTLVVPELEPGPVVAAVYAQPAEVPVRAGLLSVPVTIPKKARLRVAYTLDRIVWSGLSGAEVTVRARMLAEPGESDSSVELLRRRIEPARSAPTWFDEDVDLSRLAGRRVRFEFLSRQTGGARLVPSLIAWTPPALVIEGAERTHPSVVLVSIDGLRAQSMSCCGNSRETTPFLDKLFGAQGAIFERAIAQAVTSTASHMSLMTSLYPSVHRVLNERRALANDVRTLAEVMKGNGYATAAFTGGGTVPAELGFAEGFDVYYEDPQRYLGDPEGIVSPTLERALAWLEKNRGAPFFLFVHLQQVRSPWVPPSAYLELFKDARLQRAGKIDQGALVRYERELRYVNDRLEGFVASLDGLADPRRTVLMLTSPNGTEFGEHGALGTGTHLYDESLRVPLMIRGANVRASLRYSESIGLIDVMPTLLELAGLAIPPEVQGQSVAGSLRSGLPFELPPRFTEAWGRVRHDPHGRELPWDPPAYAMSQGMHKLILRGGTEDPVFEAYDLSADPRESSDLMRKGGAPAWAGRMKQVLRNYPLACKQVAREVRRNPEISYEARVKLQALGYAQ